MTTNTAQGIVFIDSRVPDIQDLLDGLAPGEQAFVIDSSSDGIQQIADILAENNFTDLSSIAIVSHGDSGELELGSSFITDGNLSNHSNALAEIGASLAPGGAIQLYGCDVALGAGGQQFINDFSTLAGGVTVDAATHIVGSATLGGSWTLDAASASGAPGTNGAPSAPFTPTALANFQGDLAATVQTEVWMTATGGSNDSAIVHDDDTGNGTGTNSVTLFHESLAGNPSTNYPSSLSNLTDIALDTQDNLYFLAEQNEGIGSNPNVIWVGTLAPELTNPTGTPTLTSIYSQTGAVSTTGVITGLAVDPTTKEVFFTEHQSLLEVPYSGGTVVTLATEPSTVNVFANGLALDAPHNQAFFFSSTTSGVFTANGVVNAVTSDAIYVDSNLTVQNSTPTKIVLSPADSTLGAGNFPVSLGLISGIAVDTTSEKLYFTTQPIHDPVSGTTGTGGIYEYDLSQGTSGTYHVIWLEPSSSSLFLSYIQIDHATNKYYVTGDQSADANPSVYDGALSGGTAAQSPTLFANLTMTSITQNAEGLAIDNAPTLTISALSPTWTEEGASVALISSATASDTDNTALFGATVSISGGFFAGDTLTFSTAGTSLTGSYNSSTGVLTFSGTDSFTHYQTALATVEYHGGENPDDFRSDTSRTLTWSVNDGLLTSAPQTSSVSVLFVNDPPTLSNFTANPQFTEEHAAAVLSGALSVSDPDDLNLENATVKITGGSFAGDTDVLAANTSGTSITAIYNSTTQTLTLSGTDTLADYQSVLDSVTFSSGENPNNFGSNTTRTITWVAQDPSGILRGGSDTSSTSTTTLTVNNVNDPPTLALGTTTAAWTEEGASVTLSPSLSITDVDSFGLVSATVSITGGAFTGDQLFVSGQTSGVVIAGTNITPTFAGNGLVTFNGSDTLADYQSVLELVTFNSGENPTDFGSDPTRTITWTLNDGGGTANGGVQVSSVTSTVSVTFINDPPSLSNVNTGAQYTEEQVGGTTLSSALSVSDPDDVNLLSATVKVTGGSFAGDGDVLAANGVTNGTVVNGSNTISIVYNSSTETLTLTGTDTLADYQFLLDRVTFSAGENPTDFGSNTTRSITWQIQDPSGIANGGSDVNSPINTTTVTITNVNDPPTLALHTTVANWTEEGSITTLSPTVTVTDPDNLKLTGATVSITGGTFSGDGDVLSATALGNITVSYNSSTETLTLTGSDTLADYQTALQGVTFQAGENPTDFGSNPTRTITWVLNDGVSSNNLSTVQTSTVSISFVNDAPTLTGVAPSVGATPTQTVTLSPSVTITDADDVKLKSATVTVTGGSFTGDGDVLAATTTGTNITATFSNTTAGEFLVLSGTDTLADYQSVLDSITWHSTAGDPTNGGSNTTRTLSWTVQDINDAIGGGTDTSTPQTETLTIDTPPTLSGVAANAHWTEEQGPPTTLSNAITISDPDGVNTQLSATVSITGGTFANDHDVLSANTAGTSITASYNSSTETLTLTGSDTLADYQSVLDSVTFNAGENPTDFGSNPTRALTWVVTDHVGTPSAPQSTTVSITNVNDAPTLSNVATNAAWTEEGTNATLSSGVSVSDPDNLKLVGATVSIIGGTFANDGDVLAATAVGSVTVSYNSSTETLTLTGSDTLANYQSVLDTVTFHAGENPTNFGSNPTRTVTWVLNDGSSSFATSTPVTSTISITNVNDAPTLANVATTANYTEEGAAATLSGAVSVSDPDDVNLSSAAVKITGGTFAGDGDVLAATTTGTSITASYNSSTETLTLSGADTLAHYQQVLDTVTFSAGENPTNFGSNPTRTVTWTLVDPSGTANGGVSVSTPVTSTISIANVNDAPTLSNVATSASFTQGGGLVTLSGAASVSDPDNLKLLSATVAITGGTFASDGDVLAATAVGTITVSYNAAAETLTLTGSDTLAHYQQVLDTVTFNNGSTNPTNFGSNPTRTVVWTLNDGSASNSSSTPVTETISLTGINAPPTLSNVATSANYTEEGAAATLSGSVSVSDPDDTKLSSATVKITGGTFAGDADLLAASTTGTSITASYNTSTETLTLSGTDTLAHYQQVLDSVTFAAGENPNDFGSNPTRTVTWTLMDPSGTAIGGSNVSTPVTSTISITNVNDPPTLSNVAANVRFLPHHTVTLSPALGVSDPDNLTLSNATVSVTGGTFAGDGDVLAATVTGTSITASYNSSTETLTLTGSDSLAHYQQVLDSVAFSSGNNPSNGANNRTRTVSWVVNDGSASSNLSAPATTTITIGGPPVYDFNGDGDSDLLFQQTSGTPQIWLMNGTSIISETSLATPPASWKIVTSGDFNGDGLSDILWINTSTNQPAIWEMNGTSIISAVGLAAPPSSWHIAGVGDVNGDGHSDIIWQNSDGTPSVWQMNGTSIVSATALPNPGSAWKIVATGDFNGDGNTDLLWDNTASGQPAIWEMNGSSIVSAVGLAPQPANMEIIGTGDFNGDGDADILWLNTITNAPTIWIMNGTSVTSMATLSAPPPSWRLVGTSDLYGTGKADILWQNSDGTTSVWQMNGTSIVSAIAVGTPSNPGGGWQLNNNDPPLPSAADTTTAANGGNGTTRLSMPDAANAGGGIPSYVAGAAGAGAGPTPALFSSNTTVPNRLHVGSG